MGILLFSDLVFYIKQLNIKINYVILYLKVVLFMKKIIAFIFCITLLTLTSCQKLSDINNSSNNNISTIESSSIVQSQEIISSNESNINHDTSSTTQYNSNESTTSIAENTETNNETITQQSNNNDSYENIVCNPIFDFKQVGFSVKNDNTMIFMSLPNDWNLAKIQGGYNITKNSKNIGTVTTFDTLSEKDAKKEFYNEITTNNVKVSHSIYSLSTTNIPSYTRTLAYSYINTQGNNITIYITTPYQEIDGSAVFKMITDVKTDISSTESKLGTLKIEDNRNKILIMGNSFIGSSSIGSILQTMCGSKIYVDAKARGYAHVGTYTKDPNIMQSIRNGNYSVVFMCGLYDQEAVNDLADMINVCRESNTKLAVFPAHNENQSKIDHAKALYSDTIFLSWKDEINYLISSGIDQSYFCIPDAHKHSTPLAGYVGAHMIYRAIFNEIPPTTYFEQVTEDQINILGNYVTTGTVTLLDDSSTYVIN